MGTIDVIDTMGTIVAMGTTDTMQQWIDAMGVMYTMDTIDATNTTDTTNTTDATSRHSRCNRHNVLQHDSDFLHKIIPVTATGMRPLQSSQLPSCSNLSTQISFPQWWSCPLWQLSVRPYKPLAATQH